MYLYEIRYNTKHPFSSTHVTQVNAENVSEAREIVKNQNGGDNCNITGSKRVDN